MPLSITINYKPLRNHLNHYKPIIFHYNLLTTTIHHLFTTQKNRLRPGETGGVIPGRPHGSWWSPATQKRRALFGEALFGRFLEEVRVEKTGANSGKRMGKTLKMVENYGKKHENGGKQWTKLWKWWKTMENTMNMVESRWKKLWEYGDSWKLCDGSPANIANSI